MEQQQQQQQQQQQFQQSAEDSSQRSETTKEDDLDRTGLELASLCGGEKDVRNSLPAASKVESEE